jgi:predicted nucleotidyltransferase
MAATYGTKNNMGRNWRHRVLKADENHKPCHFPSILDGLRPDVLEGYRKVAGVVRVSLEGLLSERLVSVVLFGSVARGDVSDTSDIDLLIVAKNLPDSRFERMKLFDEAEDLCRDELKAICDHYGITASFSSIMKDIEEAGRASPLYLDIVEDGVILYDRDDFMKNVLERLRRKLRELGARRVWRGKRWHWVLKPEVRVGEVEEIE